MYVTFQTAKTLILHRYISAKILRTLVGGKIFASLSSESEESHKAFKFLTKMSHQIKIPWVNKDEEFRKYSSRAYPIRN